MRDRRVAFESQFLAQLAGQLRIAASVGLGTIECLLHEAPGRSPITMKIGFQGRFTYPPQAASSGHGWSILFAMPRTWMTEIEKVALRLAKTGPVGPKELAEAAGCTLAGARRGLRVMAQSGGLVSLGRRSGGHGKRPEVFGLPGSEPVGPPVGPRQRDLPGDRLRHTLELLTKEQLVELVLGLLTPEACLEFVGLLGGLPREGRAPRSRRSGAGKAKSLPRAGYELEITVVDTEPAVWRRVVLPSDATFENLHHAIQDAFGWTDSHLWECYPDERHQDPLAGMGGMDEFTGEPVPDGRLRLDAHFGHLEGASCHYVYDFGDDWVHAVVLRQVLPAIPRRQRRLLAGERAGPPEDCGGVSGYARCAEFVRTGADLTPDPDADLAEWLGDWHPDRFDLDATRKHFDR